MTKNNQINYWKKREEKNINARKKTDQQIANEIENLYIDTLTEIQKEIDGFVGKYASKEGISVQEARKRVSDIDVKAFESKAKKYVKEKDFSSQANHELKIYNLKMKLNRLELLRSNLLLELTASSDALQKLLSKYLSAEARREFERQSGILGNVNGSYKSKIDSIVNGSYKNAYFSDRIWGIIQIDLRTALEKLLLKGIIQGLNPREIARQLRKSFDVAKNQAERLARTELARVQSEVQKQSYKTNRIDKFVFIREATACPICKAVSTDPISIDNFEVGVNAAPIHPNCRCSTAPYFDREEFEKYLEGKGL